MKKLVNGNFEIKADVKELKLKSNRMGAFTALHRNYTGNYITCRNTTEMVYCWNKLIELGYTVEEAKVSAPKQSLYVMKFEIDGKEVSGRKLWSQKYSEIRHSMITDDVRKLTGKELREAMEKIDKDAKKATREWEADFLASLK